jgi:hypothetical protein
MRLGDLIYVREEVEDNCNFQKRAFFPQTQFVRRRYSGCHRLQSHGHGVRPRNRSASWLRTPDSELFSPLHPGMLPRERADRDASLRLHRIKTQVPEERFRSKFSKDLEPHRRDYRYPGERHFGAYPIVKTHEILRQV